jgi:hypothetical protein
VCLAGYVILGFVIANATESTAAPATVIPCGLAVIAIGALCIPPSSNAHFASRPISLAPSPAAYAGIGVVTIVAIIVAAVGFNSSRNPLDTDAAFNPGPSDAPTYSYTPPNNSYTPPDLETNPTPPTATIQAGSLNQSWTITESGPDGSVQGVLSIGSPMPYQQGITNGSFVAGSGCSELTPSQDAVIPAVLRVTNTGTSDEQVGVSFSGVGPNSIPGITGPELEFETVFTDTGTTCDADSNFGVQSTQPIAPGTSVAVSGFLDITDYYSGASATQAQILDDTILTAVGDGADTSFAVTSVSGPGATNNGQWTLDLAGVTPTN